MKKIIPILLLASLASCRPQRTITETVIRDSIITNTVTQFRDTTLYVTIKGDTIINTILLRQDLTTDKSILSTDLARSVAWVEMGRLQHVLYQNDTIVPITIKNAIRLTWERAERFYRQNDTQIRTVEKTPRWVRGYLAGSMVFGMLMLIAGLIYLFRLIR